MSTTLISQQSTAPRGPDGRSRATVRRRVWLTVLVVAIIGAVFGGLIVLAWMVNETHFDRPSQEFDQLASDVESLPGVQSVEKERWVEAPTFSNPTSSMFVTVDRPGLPALIDAACTTEYPDPVSWSLRVRTPASAEVMLHATSATPGAGNGDARCPDFGFDAVPLVDELDRVAAGLTIQPIMWDADKLALVAIEDALPNGFTHLLPLVEHADGLVAAAGVDPNEDVEINSANLGLAFEPRERGAYLALLAELAEDLGVTSFYADGGGAMADGKAIVQVVAPPSQHPAIEDAITSSGLPLAAYPIRFLDR